MGNRVSVQFEHLQEHYDVPTKQPKVKLVKSVAIFHHWGGTQFPNWVLDWYKGFMKMAIIENHHDRWTPHNIALACAIEIGKTYKHTYLGETYTAHNPSIYLGKDEYDGDNTNHGNFVINMDTMVMRNGDGDVVGADDHVEEYV